MLTDKIETYQVTPAANDENNGTYYFTDCGNRMYSVKGNMAYHGKICPKCGKTLYIRGSKEAFEFFDKAFPSGDELGEYLANTLRRTKKNANTM